MDKGNEVAVLIGQRISNWRKHKHLSQEKLAELSKIGSNTISNYENGKTSPNAERLQALAKALEVTPGMLVGELPTTSEAAEATLLGGPRLDDGFFSLPFVPFWDGSPGQRITGRWPVSRDLVTSEECVVRRVTNDDMRPFLMPGDAIVVDPREVRPRSLTTVVVRVDGKVLIRRFVLQNRRRLLQASHADIKQVRFEQGHEVLARVVGAVERNLHDTMAYELGSPWRI
ncbi:MAG: helix-turn-helix domain-containing protein [bacterium]|nr:helix-turn-helix domain-containing protein [bacterium]